MNRVQWVKYNATEGDQTSGGGHKIVYRCIMKLHTWNLSNVLNQCYSNELNFKTFTIKNTLLLKNANHYLSLQGVIIFLLVEGCALVLMAADWRLERLRQFLKIRQQWSLLYWLTLRFVNDFSIAYDAIWQHLIQAELVSKLELVLSKPAATLSARFM